jgi:hypothetical protein
MADETPKPFEPVVVEPENIKTDSSFDTMSDGTKNEDWAKGAAVSGGPLDWTLALDRLKTFEYDGVNYRNDLEPKQNNLFWAGDFWEKNPDADGDHKADSWARNFINAPYRIMSIKADLPKLTFERHKYLKAFTFKDTTYADTITITWLDYVYRSVQKFHLDWINRWYNRQFDVLRTGAGGKFKSATIYVFHYVNSSVSLLDIPTIEILFRVKLMGLVPKDIGSLEFDYANAGNETPTSIQYGCNKILWEYNPAFYKDDFRKIWPEGKGFQPLAGDGPDTVWSPGAADGKSSIPSSSDMANQTEAMRLLASITPFIKGEQEIS